jgi:hypothetical protein
MREEKPLHVDEDWKSQVDKEKEQLRREFEGGTGTASAGAAPPPQAESVATPNVAEKTAAPPQPESRHLPPASLSMLISSLASQALACMGQMPGDDGQPMPVDLQFARHFIDLIGVLEEKTRSHATSDEAAFLSSTLHQLRILFVECSRRP